MRGHLVANRPLAPLTWLRVGGPADHLFLPADTDDLIEVLTTYPVDVPVQVLGAASNVLIRDGGVSGMVVRLAGARWASIERLDAVTLRAAAGVPDRRLAEYAARSSIAGLEFLASIPGTIGGAVAMNAGCYGCETRDILVRVSGVTRKGQERTLSASGLDLGYRCSALPDGFIITSVTVRGRSGSEQDIREKMDQNKAQREASQPVRATTGGSTFANPDPRGAVDQVRAWQLLDGVGAREMRLGGASFSQRHCNFLINDGTATASDLENLAQEARRLVQEKSGILLRWEIRRSGRV